MAAGKKTGGKTGNTTPKGERRTIRPERMLQATRAEVEKRNLSESDTIGDLLKSFEQSIIDEAMAALNG